ncbi:ferrochelatase [Acinetobacter rathckeae]|uniref:ferrochelatase n=1 Tax=Acinetobacter rathckeae TaxID=2605272 RepID=UPI0018A2EB3D|nr:ferrochelatase [Acinetobacter rathckeae]MBF7687846.1 ferrochelatase [Acinetobacter rathckeae]MBF7687931.1 ferrochelatase [Acinetobacter rathckeae]MBF7696016.1 ferrochelatase [Acinetobacter rathckeae]
MMIENKPKVTVILANLGTPDAATAPAVRQFLKEFLSDTRVIEIPKVLWQIILRLFILPSRPKRVAEAYASVWWNDSPMREIMMDQVKHIQQVLPEKYPHLDLNIVPAMTYGNPGMKALLQDLNGSDTDHILLFPLYPQYSATSTAPQFDMLAKWSLKQRNIPGISMIRDYYQHPLYIKALAESVRRYRAEHGSSDKLLMSFHGIPQPFADKGDPYPERCRKTAKLVAEELGLNDEQWAISFQSRFGLQEWVRPYTDELLAEWGKTGVKSVQIMSPAFSADCLETLEELAVENAENFKHAGGESYAYIPALNTDAMHLQLFETLLDAHLTALDVTLAQYTR